MDLMDQIEKHANGSNKINNPPSMSMTTDGPSSPEDLINYNFEIPPEEKQADQLLDKLFELQSHNADIVKQFFTDYQANPFGKAWGNDPDYVLLSNQLKTKILSASWKRACFWI